MLNKYVVMLNKYANQKKDTYVTVFGNKYTYTYKGYFKYTYMCT